MDWDMGNEAISGTHTGNKSLERGSDDERKV